jgi:hypothetical protein
MGARKIQVVVVGPARSGTTLVTQLLATGYGLHAPIFEGLPSGDPAVLCRRAAPVGAPGWVYKAPALVLGAEETYRVWVNAGAFILGIIRDPRAMATSLMRGVRYYGPEGWGGDLETQWTLAARSLEGVVRIPEDKGRVIRYEDLLTDTTTVQEGITSWLGLRLRVPFARAHERMHLSGPARMALNGARPLDPSRATARMDGLVLTEETQSLMVRWGYA